MTVVIDYDPAEYPDLVPCVAGCGMHLPPDPRLRNHCLDCAIDAGIIEEPECPPLPPHLLNPPVICDREPFILDGLVTDGDEAINDQ